MDFPTEILRSIGYYAVASLADAQVLDCIIPMHSKSLSCVWLEFDDVDKAVRATGALLVSGVRKLKLECTHSNACVQRLFTSMPDLEELHLGHCHGLENTHSLNKFLKLHTLSMQSCPCVAGSFLSRLRKLSLSYCGLHVSAMGALTSLELKGCAITHALPLSSDLEHLVLRGNWFGSEHCDWPADMNLDSWVNLKVLDLTTIRQFDNARVAPIALMKNLESLTLNGCPEVTDFSFLEGLDLLKTLRVEANFDWTMLRHVQLHTLAARGFEVSSLEMLGTQRDLRSLRLVQSASHRFDPVGVLSRLMPHWPNLYSLDLFYCPNLMLEHHAFPVCPSLTCFKIDFCKFVTDEKLQLLMASFPNLEVFSATFTHVSDAGLALLPLSMRDLNIRGCSITDAALPSLMRMDSLTALDVGYTGIHHLPTLPNSLTFLDVTGCTQTCVDSALKLASRVTIKHNFSLR
jgi:hypothetical protein